MLDSRSSAAAAPAASRASAPGVLPSIVRAHRRTLALVLPLGTVAEGVEMAMPIVLGLIIDRGVLAGDLRLTVLGALGLIGLRILGVLLWVWTFLLSQKACMQERHRLRVGLTGAVLDPRSRTVQRPAGEVLSIATSDADKASDLMDMLPWVVPSTLAVLVASVYLAAMDLWLGLSMLLGIVVMVVVIRVITPTLSKRYDDQQSEAAEAAATATDLVHGLRVLQGLGVQSRARAVYRRRSRSALRAALVNSRYSGISSGLTTLVTGSMLAAVVVLASLRTLDGTLSIGVLIAVVGVARYVMGMLQGLSGVPVWWASMSTSARRVRDLYTDLGRSVDDPELGLDVLTTQRDERGQRGDVTGRRGAAGGLVLPQLTVADGEIVALVCADPHDAAEAVEAVSGRVDAGARVGTRPITPGDRLGLRADLLVEPHVVDLFDGTLREQLATRAPEGTGADGDEDWDRALHAAGAEDLLRILPEGYDTRILDRGANLSGGQRQRIALARAVAADAPVLVLHDPTTAVDAVTEQNIAEALIAARRRTDRATLLVTRAPALLQEADRVVFLRSGETVAEGPHAELMGTEEYREVVRR
ncbi:ABC transporter transmembrane domain-containing protein [Brachybacterium saurashtrense]|uniref:ABC transporter ATP-binding protein n=1 Tax=Brachybacterium saurashtrense TaxID=556288 RepID=A0A345YLA9_9MICO|nr:ABC transporter ATP-binding protein [Brachybacterium saurashtrense]AXK44711.1 ABC transporter ATP-binding protein [Brachybacterium saurashtrense]RRR23323.1 ABC transporter ATP-binding protein [Brachybacterium saurashtrense]